MNKFATVVATSVAMLASIMLWVSVAHAMPNPHVQDDGGFFSADAIAKANQKIAQIKTDYGKDLYIETWPYIGDSKKGDYQPEEKDAIFKRWADEIGQKNKV